MDSRTGVVTQLWISAPRQGDEPPPTPGEEALLAFADRAGLENLGDWAKPENSPYPNALYSRNGQALITALVSPYEYSGWTNAAGTVTSQRWFLSLSLQPFSEEDLPQLYPETTHMKEKLYETIVVLCPGADPDPFPAGCGKPREGHRHPEDAATPAPAPQEETTAQTAAPAGDFYAISSNYLAGDGFNTGDAWYSLESHLGYALVTKTDYATAHPAGAVQCAGLCTRFGILPGLAAGAGGMR